MQKKKTELLELLGNRSLFDYGEERELIDELKGITKYYLPEHLVYHKGIFETVQNAFKYGAIMGIRHERKMRKEKANRVPEYKRRLVELVKDIPWWADTTCNYLCDFISFGMFKGTFRMSEGHKKEIENRVEEYEKAQEQKQNEEKEEKTEISQRDKYLCSSVNMLSTIEREDAQRYLNLLIKDVYEELYSYE